MKLLKLNLAELKDSQLNPRSELRGIDDLAKSIKAQGIIQKIVVQGSADGYTIKAGHRRRAAALKAGLVEDWCLVMPTSAGNDVETHLAENLGRDDLTPLEIGVAVHGLIADGKDRSHIAKMAGQSLAWVSKHLTIGKAFLAIAEADGDVQKFADIGSYEKTYQRARKVLGLDTKKALKKHAPTQSELPLPETIHTATDRMVKKMKAAGSIIQMDDETHKVRVTFEFESMHAALIAFAGK